MSTLAAETLPLDEAADRILAADISAVRDLPGFDNSAMDGYAVRAADVPAQLAVVGSVTAGAAVPPPLPAGSAMRIMTGAPLPPGANAVIPVEDTTSEGDQVALPGTPEGHHVRRRGEDVACGSVVARCGDRLWPGRLGLLAALGHASVTVAKRPRVAILATGDELVPVNVEPAPGQVVDSSAIMLAAQIREAGGIPFYLGIVSDQREAIAAALARTTGYDVVITTGGASVGDHDHARSALIDAGGSLELWKVAMRPGKPLAFGQLERRPVFALPGNPVSSFVAFELFVRPALLAMQGATGRARMAVPVSLPAPITKASGRAHYLRGRVFSEGGTLCAEVMAKQGSAMLWPLSEANALIELPADDSHFPAGTQVQAHLLFT